MRYIPQMKKKRKLSHINIVLVRVCRIYRSANKSFLDVQEIITPQHFTVPSQQ